MTVLPNSKRGPSISANSRSLLTWYTGGTKAQVFRKALGIEEVDVVWLQTFYLARRQSEAI